VELASRYAQLFPPAYRAEVEPAQALDDIADLEALAADPAVPQLNLRPRPGRAATRAPAHPACGGLIPISDILPMLENFGLRVLEEHNWTMTAAIPACDPGLRARGARPQARRLRRARAAVQAKRFSPRGAARSRTTVSTACCCARR
jgi:NAD-specific glutamate dehydrogenase